MPRFNVDFSDEAIAVLEDLSRKEGTTKAEILRRAIALEKWFQDTTSSGSKIVVEEPNGRVREILKL